MVLTGIQRISHVGRLGPASVVDVLPHTARRPTILVLPQPAQRQSQRVGSDEVVALNLPKLIYAQLDLGPVREGTRLKSRDEDEG